MSHTPNYRHCQNTGILYRDETPAGYLPLDRPEAAAHIVLCANLHDELVEALKECAYCMDRMDLQPGMRGGLALKAARALLAKAEGGAK